MSIFENMGPREIAICLSKFYEAAQKYRPVTKLLSTQVCLPDRNQPISLFLSDFDEGIKILREDYGIFWTPDTKPDDLKWKINKRRMMLSGATHWELETYDRFVRKYIDTDSVVAGNDYLYRRELGLPDNATVADILGRIRDIREANENQAKHASKLVQSIADISKERDEADRLRRHWHVKYEKEHEEYVRLSKLHVADKEKKNKQDATIRELSNQNATLGYSVAALKKRIRSMEAEAAEKETKNKVIIGTLRDNLVDSIEECKKLNGRIHDLEALVVNLTHDDKEDE